MECYYENSRFRGSDPESIEVLEWNTAAEDQKRQNILQA